MLILLGVFFVVVGFVITWLMSRRLTESEERVMAAERLYIEADNCVLGVTADNAALGQEIVERDERLAEAKLNAEYWRRKYEEVIADQEPEEITTELLPLEIEVVAEEPPPPPKKNRRRAKKGK